MKKSEDYSS
ncbi:Chloramphenicol resistance leader peptide [Abyssicoccus albus]|uniref:Chloramphenicol resistance leader peptide n=6 Tax=root TaxID=1 RepID=LPCA_STAAU|nr:RecName: Full=Chloramphenicol resistance leader peptide [Staphylococcus aureus]P0A062.1 RecName: Full=Chloramphenicol resistance leader peptide [Streptococcus agalactiae]AAA26612.1 precursor protein [Staphylococcus aureus subsp. aureus RN4220]AAA26614.1 chloramphenicol acetyltransferase [Staphylococcus intermedius]AAB00803.1 chloramphenicol acetyltransferase [Plasmid pSBK203]AFN69317.1 cat leader peptide [Listeria monocytogenes]AAA16528.1 precursor protein [Staphylococcus aureus]